MSPRHRSCTRSGCSRAGADVWDALSACPSCHTPYPTRPTPWKAATDMTIRLARPVVRRVLNRVPRPKVTAGRVWLTVGLSVWVLDGVHVVTTPLSWSTFDQGAGLLGVAGIASLVWTIRADRRQNRGVQSLVGWVAYPTTTEDDEEGDNVPSGAMPGGNPHGREHLDGSTPAGPVRFTVIRGGAAA